MLYYSGKLDIVEGLFIGSIEVGFVFYVNVNVVISLWFDILLVIVINGCFYVELGFVIVIIVDVVVLYVGIMVGVDLEMEWVVIVSVFYVL